MGSTLPTTPKRAIAWHAFFWDRWFAAWGGAFTVAIGRNRPQSEYRRQ
jgi:hypothetical protein